jgi:NADH-ubiquinone oxidoreductase chain 4
MLLLFILINTFLVMDILLFFLIFESSVIPLFLLIAIWGSISRKIYASYLLLSYTLLGSVFLLIIILYLYINIGTTSYISFIYYNFFNNIQIIIFISCFIGFGIKIPLIPFHI